jgi:hypothetical protein
VLIRIASVLIEEILGVQISFLLCLILKYDHLLLNLLTDSLNRDSGTVGADRCLRGLCHNLTQHIVTSYDATHALLLLRPSSAYSLGLVCDVIRPSRNSTRGNQNIPPAH